MDYYEIKISCPAGQTEEAENLLIINGITDYFVSDPQLEADILNEMNWLIKDELLTGDAEITVCVSEKAEAEKIAEIFNGSFKTEIRGASDSEWKDNWKQFARAVRIDEGLVVQPVWVDYEKKDDEKIIYLDSGAAFGTGTHETTSQCAKMLRRYMQKNKNSKNSRSLLDIGTGSGILAIVGAVSGADKIVATDIDEVAVETAKINIKKNNCEKICDVRCGNLLECVGDEKFDIITANIIVDVLLNLFSDVKKVMKPDSVLIMSGILEERIGEIRKKAAENGFFELEKTDENDWCCISFGLKGE